MMSALQAVRWFALSRQLFVEHLHVSRGAVEDTTRYHKGANAQIDDPATEEDTC